MSRATLGLSVPADLSIVSFDDTPIVRFSVPALTAVDQPIAATASRAVELIIDAQRGDRLARPAGGGAGGAGSAAIDGAGARVTPPVKAARPPDAGSRFLWLFALAWAGGAVAYVPFLTILLPLRVVAIAGADSVRLLGLITFFGALAASVGNILFGWLSDRGADRRPWVAAGLLISLTLLVLVPLGRDPVSIVALVVCWQLALNMMLGPLAAWAADRVPRHRTGFLGGLMALVAGARRLVGRDCDRSRPGRRQPAAVAGRGDGRGLRHPGDPVRPQNAAPPTSTTRPTRVGQRGASRRGCGSRGCSCRSPRRRCSPICLLYFRTLDPGVERKHDRAAVRRGARGRAADRDPCRALRRPQRAPGTATGDLRVLLGAWRCWRCRLASNVGQAVAAYILFGLATTVFLSLHSGLTLRVLPDPEHRGRDLGIFNLTNTVPSLIMPWLTILIVPTRGFAGLFVVLAVLASASAALLFTLKRLD